MWNTEIKHLFYFSYKFKEWNAKNGIGEYQFSDEIFVKNEATVDYVRKGKSQSRLTSSFNFLSFILPILLTADGNFLNIYFKIHVFVFVLHLIFFCCCCLFVCSYFEPINSARHIISNNDHPKTSLKLEFFSFRDVENHLGNVFKLL